MNESQIYKKLAGGSKHPVGKIIGYVLIGMLIFNITMAVFFAIPGNTTVMSILGVLVGIAVVIIYARFAIKWAKKAQRQIDKRFELLESIGDAEWSSMDDQMAREEFWFDTFYQLEDYLYVPKARLLIRYVDIKLFKTVVHKTNGVKNGVHIEITDEEDLICQFYVKRWREYLEFQQTFMDKLNEKRARQAGAPQ